MPIQFKTQIPSTVQNAEDSTYLNVFIDSNDGLMKTKDNTGIVAIVGNGGGSLTDENLTSSATLSIGVRYHASQPSGIWSATLDASPINGSVIEIIDIGGTFESESSDVSPNSGHTINGSGSPYILNKNYAHWTFVFDSTTNNWVATISTTAGGGGLTNPLTADLDFDFHNITNIQNITGANSDITISPGSAGNVAIKDGNGDFVIDTTRHLYGVGTTDAFDFANASAPKFPGLTPGSTSMLIVGTDGTISYDTIPSGGGMSVVQITDEDSGLIMSPNTRYIIKNNDNPFGVQLPASASLGDIIELVSASGTMATNYCDINNNGFEGVDGPSGTYRFDTDHATLQLVYSGSDFQIWESRLIPQTSGGGSGFSNPATVDLNMDQNDIINLGTIINTSTGEIHCDSDFILSSGQVKSVSAITTGSGGMYLYDSSNNYRLHFDNSSGYKIDLSVGSVGYTITSSGNKFDGNMGFYGTTPVSRVSAPSNANSSISGSVDTSLESAYNDLAQKFNDLVDYMISLGLMY